MLVICNFILFLMDMDNYFSKEHLDKLKQELEYLKKTKRMEVGQRIRSAAAMGDLSENFEYSSAKEEQEFVERRIDELIGMIASAVVVEPTGGKGPARIGSSLSLRIEGEIMDILLTGPQEANPMEGKISIASPLGSALVGKNKGDKAVVETPGGKTQYEILDVS